MTPDDLPDAMANLNLNADAAIAAADLVGRTGATSLDFGYLHDNVPSEDAAWWAHAQYRGTRVSVENHRGPVEALEALALKLLIGGQCQGCGGLIALTDEGAFAFTKSTLLDGRKWDAEHAAATRQCRWHRAGARWEMGCKTQAPAKAKTSDGPATVRNQPKKKTRRARKNR